MQVETYNIKVQWVSGAIAQWNNGSQLVIFTWKQTQSVLTLPVLTLHEMTNSDSQNPVIIPSFREKSAKFRGNYCISIAFRHLETPFLV